MLYRCSNLGGVQRAGLTGGEHGGLRSGQGHDLIGRQRVDGRSAQARMLVELSALMSPVSMAAAWAVFSTPTWAEFMAARSVLSSAAT